MKASPIAENIWFENTNDLNSHIENDDGGGYDCWIRFNKWVFWCDGEDMELLMKYCENSNYQEFSIEFNKCLLTSLNHNHNEIKNTLIIDFIKNLCKQRKIKRISIKNCNVGVVGVKKSIPLTIDMIMTTGGVWSNDNDAIIYNVDEFCFFNDLLAINDNKWKECVIRWLKKNEFAEYSIVSSFKLDNDMIISTSLSYFYDDACLTGCGSMYNNNDVEAAHFIDEYIINDKESPVKDDIVYGCNDIVQICDQSGDKIRSTSIRININNWVAFAEIYATGFKMIDNKKIHKLYLINDSTMGGGELKSQHLSALHKLNGFFKNIEELIIPIDSAFGNIEFIRNFLYEIKWFAMMNRKLKWVKTTDHGYPTPCYPTPCMLDNVHDHFFEYIYKHDEFESSLRMILASVNSVLKMNSMSIEIETRMNIRSNGNEEYEDVFFIFVA